MRWLNAQNMINDLRSMPCTPQGPLTVCVMRNFHAHGDPVCGLLAAWVGQGYARMGLVPDELKGAQHCGLDGGGADFAFALRGAC